MIMVREPGEPAPDTVEYRHGLTPPMRDARKRRFRREPDLNVIYHLVTFCDFLKQFACSLHFVFLKRVIYITFY